MHRHSSLTNMTKMTGRNHNLTLAVGFIITCVVMLLFLLNKTHDKLEESRTTYFALEEKYASVVKQFETLYEYKERLENSFKDFKEKKSPIISETDSLRSELAVLKTSHKNEIQRLHEELDACRRREEMAIVNRAQKDDGLSPSSLVPQSPSLPISPVEDVHSSSAKEAGPKVISSLSQNRQNQSGKVQPSMDPNVDLAGNVMV